MLRGKSANWYHQRHELFSLYFILNSDIPQKAIVAYTVLGHHKSMDTIRDYVLKNYVAADDNEWADDDELSYEDECHKWTYPTYQICCQNMVFKYMEGRYRILSH